MMVKVEDRPSGFRSNDRDKQGNEVSPHTGEVQEKPPQERPAQSAEDSAAEHHQDEETSSAPRSGFIGRHPLLVALGVIALIGAAIGGYMWWSISSLYETTDDAFIQARFFTVSPKVAGYIVSVPVTDNQMIKTGDTLTIIDDRDYKTALASAEAQLAQAEAALPNIDAQIAGQEAQISQAQAQINDAEAALKFAKEQNDRAQHLAKTGAGTVQTAQQTESQLLQAQATADRAHAALNAAQKQLAALKAQRVSAEGSIQQAGAQRDQARLNLGYTLVKADQAGRVTQLTAAKGQLVQAGQSLMVIVPDPLWVVANFRETQISGMKAGQPVDISVDAYPNQTFKGHVDSIQSGSGTVFSLLPAENATGNFVKVVQRVPVKIDFDKKPEVILGPGMSVVPWVRIK